MSERPSDGVMAWAAVGSRISGFHHDSASKLQSLMMALDEASELAADRAEVLRPLETAMASLRELHALLTENRALAKAPARKPVRVAELLLKAGSRFGVKVAGELPVDTVHVAPPSIVHALALLCDVLAGPPHGARTIEAAVEPGPVNTIVSLAGILPTASVLDAITVATWLVEREGGRVFSAPRGFIVHLPTRAAATP